MAEMLPVMARISLIGMKIFSVFPILVPKAILSRSEVREDSKGTQAAATSYLFPFPHIFPRHRRKRLRDII